MAYAKSNPPLLIAWLVLIFCTVRNRKWTPFTISVTTFAFYWPDSLFVAYKADFEWLLYIHEKEYLKLRYAVIWIQSTEFVSKEGSKNDTDNSRLRPEMCCSLRDPPGKNVNKRKCKSEKWDQSASSDNSAEMRPVCMYFIYARFYMRKPASNVGAINIDARNREWTSFMNDLKRRTEAF